MSQWYKIYFQKGAAGSAVKDTLSEWEIVCKEFPFKLSGDAKPLPTRSYADEHGEETYYPDEMPIEAYDLEVEFGYKGKRDTANVQVGRFLNYLKGVGGTGTYLKVYDTYTRIGRQGLSYKSVSEELTERTDENGDLLIFKVTFRVADPTTEITLST
jgi:hypothetical protein